MVSHHLALVSLFLPAPPSNEQWTPPTSAQIRHSDSPASTLLPLPCFRCASLVSPPLTLLLFEVRLAGALRRTHVTYRLRSSRRSPVLTIPSRLSIIALEEPHHAQQRDARRRRTCSIARTSPKLGGSGEDEHHFMCQYLGCSSRIWDARCVNCPTSQKEA